jgi:hypothetical protein
MKRKVLFISFLNDKAWSEWSKKSLENPNVFSNFQEILKLKMTHSKRKMKYNLKELSRKSWNFFLAE